MGIFAKIGLLVLSLILLFFVFIPFVTKRFGKNKDSKQISTSAPKQCDCEKSTSTVYPMVGGTVVSLGNQPF